MTKQATPSNIKQILSVIAKQCDDRDSCLPEMGSPRVKYLLAVETVPTDPWPKAQQ